MGLEVTRMMEERVEHGHEFINMIVTKKEKGRGDKEQSVW